PARIRLALGIGVRHLSERGVFGKSTRGEVLRSTRQQREQRASRRIRTGSPAREVSRNRRAAKRFFKMRPVLGRRAQEHRDLIEGNPGSGFRLNAPGDLDTLASLAGRGAERNAVVQLFLFGLRVLEQMSLQGCERTYRFCKFTADLR